MKNNTVERKAFIFNKQKYNMYDGPGVRSLIFFKGCPLRCKWCANPEGLQRKYEVMFKHNNCVGCGACVSACPAKIHVTGIDGMHKIDRNINCIGCKKCESACFYDAITIIGEQVSISDLLNYLEEDRIFYEQSGGGITLGGGEVLAQPEAAKNLLMVCKREGLNTAVETCGYTKKETILEVAEFVDLFLFDIKSMNSDTHLKLTGVRNEIILENIKALLNKRYNVKVRMPLLKDINDKKEEIISTIEFLMEFKDAKNFKGIDLLPYHKMGVNKYEQLDMEYPIQGDPSLSDEELTRIESWIKDYDFPVAVIRH